MSNFEKIIGETFDSVTSNDESVEFSRDGEVLFRLTHIQDCCEDVRLEEIHGDLEDLTGSPILLAEESYQRDDDGRYGDTSTWSFYKFATARGHVTIRFYGTSNGYYSETADLLAKGDWCFNR